MKEKILDSSKDMTLQYAIDHINKIVNKKFEIVENNDDIGKWTSLPILLLESEESQAKILKFIEYVDDMFITKDEKISYIITLSSLIKFGQLDITDIETGMLFILADYFNEKNMSDFETDLNVVYHPLIINAVRNKTLDKDVRVKMLHYIYKTYTEKNENSETLDNFAKEISEMIEKLDYYEIIKLIEE